MITDSQRFFLSGWLSIVSAVVTIPLLILAFLSGFAEETKPILINSILNIIYLVISIYVLLSFRLLLNKIANFHRVDLFISLLIWISAIATIISVFAALFPFLMYFFGILSIILMIALGIISFFFGIKLLKCTHDLFGYLKTFSYLTIASGVLAATVILIFFSFLTSIAADVILALIFFNGVKAQKREPVPQVEA